MREAPLKYSTLIYCLALVVHTQAAVAAERYVFDVFGPEQGLANSTVTRLARDHLGALWVGTENGLYRYDGHRFLAFTTSDGLPGNKITAIHESPDGTLWVGTLEGLAWREGARFRRATSEVLKGYINIQGIASDRTGRVFVATRKGVALTSPPTPGRDLQVTFLPWPAVVSERRSSDVYVASPDEVWFDCDVAICRWNGREVRVWDRNVGVPPRRWDLFLKDRNGNLWARNRESFIELRAGADRFQMIGPEIPGPIPVPSELAMDSKGRILVTTNHGLAIGGPGDWHRITEKQGLPANYVTAILQDSEGSMWLGTYGAGLVRWAGYDGWRSFTEVEGLASSSIVSLLDDPPSGMWAGTAAGLSHGVFSRGSWTWSEISIPGVGLASNLTRSKDGALWISTDGHYVVRYDPTARTSRRLGPFTDGPFHLRIDSAGRLWIAEAGSIAVIAAQSQLQDLERIRPPGATSATQFTATLEDARGNLWIGSMSGLFRRTQSAWLHYDTRNGLRANRIVDLALSPEDDLWVTYSEPKGTDRVRVNGDTVQVENFDRSKGLTSDHINSIAFDRSGQMWILNDHGAAVRRGDTWMQFSRADGLIGTGSTGRAFWAETNGAIWIGSERGLSRYQPGDAPLPNSGPVPVTFSEIRIGNENLDPGLSSFTTVHPQTFEAKFSALLLAHGQNVQYRYRFVGFDDRWQETTRPEARLDYPPPGRYRLEVQARIGGQLWSEPPVALPFEVRPQWYQTKLFWAVVLAVTIGALWLLGRLRQRKAAATQEALRRTVDQRTAELRESEERFRNMADTAPVMIWVSDADRHLTFFNKTWLDFTGDGKDRKSSSWTEGVHSDDVAHCAASYDCAFNAHLGFRTEFKRRRADGEYRWVLCSGIPRLTAGGAFAGFIGTEIDITDVKRAEQELVSNQAVRDSEEKYHGIVETMTEGVWILDGQDRTTFVNQQMAAMLGYRVEEMLGRHVLEFKDEEARPIAMQKLERRRRGITEQYDSTFQTRDGRRLTVLVSTRPLWDGGGAYKGTLGVITDITERSQLEGRLHQAQKMEAIGRLAGGVAHDFNNLLTVINGYSDLLLKKLSTSDRIHSELSEIRSAGRRAQDITSQMLAFSRRQMRATEVLSLRSVIEDVAKMLRHMIGEDIELVTDFEPGIGHVKADRTELTQILLNLAANARDAMPKGGILTFKVGNVELDENYAKNHSATRVGAFVLLEVIDTGVGMDAETQQHLFEPFFTTKQVGKGTGLGLATVYGIVSQCSGWIEVKSKARKGTTFQIFLPRVDATAANTIEQTEPSRQHCGTETVLVVEDQPHVRKLTCAILREYGYETLEASNGEDALRLAGTYTGPLHLVLTDVIMPGMHGPEMAHRLKGIRRLPILFMSGYSGSMEGEQVSGFAHIGKPFTPDALARKVREVLDSANQKGETIL